MQLPNRQRFAVALMAFSLGLLLLFLGLFVRKVYLDELDTLKRESSLLFVNAVRGIEGELFDQLIVHRREGLSGLERPDLPHRLPVPEDRDSLQVFTYVQKRSTDSGSLRRDTQLRIQIANDQPLTDNPDMRGALSIMVAMGEKRRSIADP